MDISCSNCDAKFKIPDGKIPPGKTASLACPKCKSKISVTAPGEENDSEAVNSLAAGFDFDDGDSDEENYAAFDEASEAEEKPFDFVEEEGKMALLCEKDQGVAQKIKTVLNFLEYHIVEADSIREALKRMRYEEFDLIIVNEKFDTENPDANGVLIYLERLNMSIRRTIFVAMLTKRYRTMDTMMGFNKSVDLVINLKYIDDFEKILKRGLADHSYFFRIYNESLKNMGLI